MGIKLDDYLKRKGMTIEKWLRSNRIGSEMDLRAKLGQLGISTSPDEIRDVIRIAGNTEKKSNRTSERVMLVDMHPSTKIEPQLEQPQHAEMDESRVKRRKKKDEPSSV